MLHYGKGSSLFRGQSGVERGFNMNEGFSVENQSEICLKALRMVIDHMQAKETAPHSIKIHKDLRKSVGLACKRAAEIALTRKGNKVVSEWELKRKIVSEEIQDVQARKRFLTRKRILWCFSAPMTYAILRIRNVSRSLNWIKLRQIS